MNGKIDNKISTFLLKEEIFLPLVKQMEKIKKLGPKITGPNNVSLADHKTKSGEVILSTRKLVKIHKNELNITIENHLFSELLKFLFNTTTPSKAVYIIKIIERIFIPTLHFYRQLLQGSKRNYHLFYTLYHMSHNGCLLSLRVYIETLT